MEVQGALARVQAVCVGGNAGALLTATLLELLTARWGSITAMREQLRAGTLTRRALRTQAEGWLGELLAGAVAEWDEAFTRQDVTRRLVDLALDAVESERMCPELVLEPHAVSLPDVPVHALIFSAFPHVANELYPLLVDAYVADLAQSGERTLALGVHEQWLHGGMIRRAIIFDEATQGLREADLLAPIHPRSAQVLALDLREEQATHARVAMQLAEVPFVNPASGAAQLDDKAWTGACWQRAGLATPAFVKLSAIDAAAIQRALLMLSGSRVVVKPLAGTEGQGVAFFTREAADAGIQADLCAGPVLVSEERGAVRWAAPSGPVRCTLRLNVVWDGQAAYVESGYAQVARDSDGVASAGRGGRLITLRELWTSLCLADGRAVQATAADWQRVLLTAAAGTEALAVALGATMPGLVGIDLLLDYDGVLQPVLLEANGRPAGMSHSRFVTAEGPTDEPGVSLHLWQVVPTLPCRVTS